MKKKIISIFLIFSLCMTFFTPAYSETVFATKAGIDLENSDDAETDEETDVDVPEITLIELDKESKLVALNETYQLVPTVLPEEAPLDIVYESSDEEIVTVNETGLLTPKKEGTAVVTVSSAKDSEIQASMKIAVVDVPTTLSLNKESISLMAIEQYQIEEAKLTYVSGKEEVIAAEALTFVSDNSSVATVSEEGVVTAIENTAYPQFATITVSYEYSYTDEESGEEYNAELKKDCYVTVTKIPVTDLVLQNGEYETTLKIGETYTLFPKLAPANATEPGVTYKTENKKIATVSSDGVITAKDIGETMITVAAKDNAEIKTEFIVKVYQTEFDVTDFGADGTDKSSDAKAIKKTLEYAKKIEEPITVRVPAGNYIIDSILTIYSDTNLILDKKAVMKRKDGKSKNAMLRSYVNSKISGYTQCENVTVSGGVWDGNSDGSYNSNCIYFGHAQNVTIKNTTVKNTSGAHLIELAGVKNATIDNVKLYGYKKCKKKGYNTNQAVKEAIQLDYCSSVTAPAMKPYDNLHCKDITIKNCDIRDYMTGIGSHMIGKKAAENVTIQNNKFSKITDTCIRLLNYKNVTISGNKASGFSSFLYTYSAKGTIKNNSIKNKSFKKLQSSGLTSQNGITISAKSYFTISDNTIQNCKSNAICVWNKSTAVIKDNTLSSNKLYGIRTKASTVSLSKNSISKNKEGMYHTYSDAKIKASDDIRAYYVPIKKSYKYTGKSIKPKIKIKGLKLNKHYKVIYKKNKKPGKATIYIKGKGKIKGTKKVTFKII